MLYRCVHSLIIAVCVLLAGCSNESVLEQGITTSLYTPDTSNRANLQDKYFQLMCLRAGVGSSASAATETYCSFAKLQQSEWRRVVLAALNDIDDRCEAYLSSLDAAKRDREGLLATLKNAGHTASLIATTAGADPHAISIMEIVFGLAESSLDNYYSRLILAVEKSTVQGLVLKRQTAYREDLLNRYMQFVKDKAAAFIAMRGYLRICLPSTIEARITSTIDNVYYLPRERNTTRMLSGQLSSVESLAARTSVSAPHRDPDLESLRALGR